MSTTPTNSRFPFEAQIQSMPSEHQYVVKNLWNSIFDAQNAIPILKAQIDANKSAVASVTNTVTNNSTASETVVQSYSPTIGFVNSQVGNTTYSTTQADYGAFILLNDASPIAVSLRVAPVIQLPWYATFINYSGAGTATLSPVSGTINGGASYSLLPNSAVTVAFDGTNFETSPVSNPQNTPAILHQFITSYNALTGVFSQAQPGFSDISGQIAPATQMPASGVVAGSYTLASITVNAEGQITAASNGTGGGILTGTVTVPSGGSSSGTFTGTGTVTGATTGMSVAASAPGLIGLCGIHQVSWCADVASSNTVEVQLTLPAISGLTWSDITFQVRVLP